MNSSSSRRRRGRSISSASPSSWRMQEAPSPLHWKFSQVLGELPLPAKADGDTLQDDITDMVSAVEFDARGEHLAAGDHGGRVILFRRTDDNHLRSQAGLERTDYAAAGPPRYTYMTEFQSHEQEFDCLNSLEIDEKISKLRWCTRPNDSLFILSANDRTIKLWKVSDRKSRKERETHLRPYVPPENVLLGDRGFFPPDKEPAMTNGHYLEWTNKKPRNASPDPNEDSDQQVAEIGDGCSAKCRRVYSHAHEYNINSISNNSDGETFISSDDLRINLWHLEVTGQCFNIIDTKPSEMEDLR